MAAYFLTSNPNNLLAAFKKAIDDGHVVTWSYDSDGDFTHAATQWKNLAWFRPTAKAGRLVLNILKSQNSSVSKEVYAIYHGRIIESLLAHCDNMFSEATATALASTGDMIK